jgi:hypothetical protein
VTLDATGVPEVVISYTPKIPTSLTANPVLVRLSGPKVYLTPSATLTDNTGTPLPGRTLADRGLTNSKLVGQRRRQLYPTRPCTLTSPGTASLHCHT